MRIFMWCVVHELVEPFRFYMLFYVAAANNHISKQLATRPLSVLKSTHSWVD